jgi:hypothetical protein
VFIRSMQLHAPDLACRIAQSWELSDLATTALREQVDRVPPGQMRPLGRATYFGELAGMLTVLGARDAYSWDGARALLTGQGLSRRTAHAVWHAAAELGPAAIVNSLHRHEELTMTYLRTKLRLAREREQGK